ncbi:unnamed protein product [Porites evermanni]|uniref:Uncharacterized protein n=1 Tax=Porites evermanni TaxID=104178 RepID=A0ABN8Q9H2_9CNID|nr:unnamed protein product [Porites evermanni]
MDGNKMAKFLLLLIAVDLLLFSSTEGKPWWKRRRSSRRRCSSSRPGGVAWVNQWQQPFSYYCSSSYFLNFWQSQHRNCKEDRIHYFRCGYGPAPYSASNCFWTYTVNSFDGPVNFKCPYNGFITGVASDSYSGHHKDRTFRFRCCDIKGYLKHSCHHTLYQNNWDQELKYSVPYGFYLSGVESYHDNHRDSNAASRVPGKLLNCGMNMLKEKLNFSMGSPLEV